VGIATQHSWCCWGKEMPATPLSSSFFKVGRPHVLQPADASGELAHCRGVSTEVCKWSSVQWSSTCSCRLHEQKGSSLSFRCRWPSSPKASSSMCVFLSLLSFRGSDQAAEAHVAFAPHLHPAPRANGSDSYWLLKGKFAGSAGQSRCSWPPLAAQPPYSAVPMSAPSTLCFSPRWTRTACCQCAAGLVRTPQQTSCEGKRNGALGHKELLRSCHLDSAPDAAWSSQCCPAASQRGGAPCHASSRGLCAPLHAPPLALHRSTDQHVPSRCLLQTEADTRRVPGNGCATKASRSASNAFRSLPRTLAGRGLGGHSGAEPAGEISSSALSPPRIRIGKSYSS